MLRHVRVGLIVWGGIIAAVGFVILTFMLSNSLYDDVSAAIVFPIILLIGGGVMIVFGVIKASQVKKYNNEIASRQVSYVGRCPHCGAQLNCTIQDFRPHGRYPEGFMYCRVCKQPVSKNAFQEVAPYQAGAAPYNHM